MIVNERAQRQQQLIQSAQQIMTAARTAPKSRGVDIIEILMVTGEEKEAIAHEMEELFEENGMPFFLRDAQNIRDAGVILLFATPNKPVGINCGYCGFPTCEARTSAIPCTLNSTDLGIALGSAAATAADLRIDNRIMYSAGKAALDLGFFSDCNQCFALPLSIGSKNIFVDRKTPQK